MRLQPHLLITYFLALFWVYHHYNQYFSPIEDNRGKLEGLIEGFRAEWNHTHIEEVPEQLLQSEFHSHCCPEGLHALRHYTSPVGFVPIVTTLLPTTSNRAHPPKHCTVGLMLEALRYFSQGNTTIFFRGMSERKHNDSSHTAGNAINEGSDYTFPTFASFSRSYAVAYTFAMKERKKGRDPFILVTLSRSGKDISALSCYPGEQEELHPPNSTFTIVMINPNTTFLNTNNTHNTVTTTQHSSEHFPMLRHVFAMDKSFGWTPEQAKHFFANYFTLSSPPTFADVSRTCLQTSLKDDCPSLFPPL